MSNDEFWVRVKEPFDPTPFWPLLVLFLTLIYGTLRDSQATYDQIRIFRVQAQYAHQPIEAARKKALFMASLKDDLQKLAEHDPVAARVMDDFYSPSAKIHDDDDHSSPATGDATEPLSAPDTR